jgi:AraC-like DNA-binding protein
MSERRSSKPLAITYQVNSAASPGDFVKTLARNADKFQRVGGELQLEYLTQWRMRAAAQQLGSTTDTVLGIANEVGYTSEFAFSTAFEKYSGEVPREYRKKRLLN